MGSLQLHITLPDISSAVQYNTMDLFWSHVKVVSNDYAALSPILQLTEGKTSKQSSLSDEVKII